MRRIVCLAVLLGPACALWAWGDEAARPAAATPTVAQLVEQLASSSFPVREAAVKALEDRGPEVLPELRKALTHPDAEVRRRLQELVPVLERATALAPKRVSLHLTNRPLREALDEINKQTGYQITLQQNSDRDRLVYSFDFDQLTFWEAIDQLAEAGHLGLQPRYNETLSLNHQERFSPYVYRNGPFRLVANGFEHTRSVDFTEVPRNGVDPGQQTDTLHFSFSVSAEPKLRILETGEARLTAAYDDQQRSMLLPVRDPDPEGRTRFNRFRRSSSYYRGSGLRGIQVELVRPSLAARTAKTIKGTVQVTLLSEKKPGIIIEDFLNSKGKTFKAGKTTWNMEDVTEVKAGGNKAYRMKMSLTQGEEASNVWRHNFSERVEVLDAKGNKYQMEESSWSSDGSGNVQAELQLGTGGRGQLGPPIKLIFYTWLTIQHAVPFEFTHLPLP